MQIGNLCAESHPCLGFGNNNPLAKVRRRLWFFPYDALSCTAQKSRVILRQNLTNAAKFTCVASQKINVRSAEYSLRFPYFPFSVLIVACRCSFIENS